LKAGNSLAVIARESGRSSKHNGFKNELDAPLARGMTEMDAGMTEMGDAIPPQPKSL
jgi:hypothetical protein